jgi:hypothetical protein
VRKSLLFCGILSMLWYIAINIIVPGQYPGYNIDTQTVSELSAIDAPTRQLWFLLCIFYSILFIAFGLGIWFSARGDWRLSVVAVVIILDGVFGFFWPPMHRREIISAGGGTMTDTLHVVWAFVHLFLMLLMISFGAAAFGKSFRIFSVFIVLIFIVFGILTANVSGGIEANQPTLHLGTWERINIGAYMIWVMVFGIMLIKRNRDLSVC